MELNKTMVEMNDAVFNDTIEQMQVSIEDFKTGDNEVDKQLYKDMNQIGTFVEDLAVEVVAPTC